MNCCDANGKCKGGHGCPVGDMPIQLAKGYEEEPGPGWWEIGAALLVMLFVVLLMVAFNWEAL